MINNFTEKEAKELIKGKLSRFFGISEAEASKEQLYKAVVMVVRDILLEKRKEHNALVKKKQAKRVYYLCQNVFWYGGVEGRSGIVCQQSEAGLTLVALLVSCHGQCG